MAILLKIVVLVTLTAVLLVTGFALGYPIGKHAGFETGSEWALIQANLAAREAGVIMPVYYEDGQFHVVIRPKPGSHRKAIDQPVMYAEAAVPENVPAAEPIMLPAPALPAPDPGRNACEQAPVPAEHQVSVQEHAIDF